MRGRKRKPTETHKRNGNPGRRKLNTSEPSAGRNPEKPEDLDKPGSALWDHAVECFSRMGILDKADETQIRLMCLHWSKIQIYQETLERDGHFLETIDEHGNRQVKVHPAIIQLNSSTRLLKSMLSDFGMNPAARVHLGNKEEQEDELAKLLSKVGKN